MRRVAHGGDGEVSDYSPCDVWADHPRGQDALEGLLGAEITEFRDPAGGDVVVEEAAPASKQASQRISQIGRAHV